MKEKRDFECSEFATKQVLCLPKKRSIFMNSNIMHLAKKSTEFYKCRKKSRRTSRLKYSCTHL